MGILTNIDKIAKKIRSQGKVVLTDTEQAQYERWTKIDQLIRNGSAKPTIVGILMQDFGVSRATAYNDYKDAQTFFGSEAVNDKDYFREIYRDMVMKDILVARRLGDLKALAMLWRNLIDIVGLKAKDNIEFDPELFQGNTYQLAITINDQNFTLDMDKVGQLPEAQLNSLIQALQSPKLSAAEYLAILEQPEETVDGTSEEITE